MIEARSVIIETEVKEYIDTFWPEEVINKLDPEGFDCTNLMKIAAAEGLETDRMHLTVHARYELYGFEKVGRVIKAVFYTNPLCWTDNPSDWWWTTQRDNESFKDLLRGATDTRERVYIDLPEVKLIPIPRWFSKKLNWRLIKK